MALKIQTVDESIESNGIKALVYGMLGSGKTRLCASPAASDQPVIIGNAEGGLRSLKNLPDEQKKWISVVRLSNFNEVEEFYSYLSTGHDFAWVCIDSISEVAEVCLTNEKANNSDGRAAYGNLADIMMGTLRAFRDLPDYNILMSAKMTRFTDEMTNRTMYWPLMPGKQLTNGIGYLFDEVMALRVETDNEGTVSRWLQTSRDIQYEAKDRSGILEMFEGPDLAAIAAKINGAVPETKQSEEENSNGENA